MAKKSGKRSTPAEKRRKAPKGRAAVADTAAAGGPPAAVVEFGQAERSAAETAGAQTTPVDGAASNGPGAEAVNETHEVLPPSQASRTRRNPRREAPGAGEGGGDAAATDAPARPQGRGKNRAAKTRPADAAATPARLSALDAAAKVLAEEGRAMGCQEMIRAMAARGYWTSPGGKTPAATLYSAVLKVKLTKGTQSRFSKTERGKFGLAARVRRRPAHGRHGGPRGGGLCVVGGDEPPPGRPVASWANWRCLRTAPANVRDSRREPPDKRLAMPKQCGTESVVTKNPAPPTAGLRPESTSCCCDQAPGRRSRRPRPSRTPAEYLGASVPGCP